MARSHDRRALSCPYYAVPCASSLTKVEDMCLNALEWRLGPYFLDSQLDERWTF